MRDYFNTSVIIAGLIAVIGIIQFFAGVYSAICYFGDEPYLWSEHFLSDLGRATTIHGTSNEASSSIFNSAVIRLGFCLMPFFILAPIVLGRFQMLISVAGLISTFGLIGVGLTPYDQMSVLHHVAVFFWVAPMLVAMIAFVIGAIAQGISPYVLSTITILVLVSGLAYAGAGSHTGHVVFQKLLAVSAMAWFFAVLSMISVSFYYTVAPRRFLAEEQAVEYMDAIRYEHRKRQTKDPN